MKQTSIYVVDTFLWLFAIMAARGREIKAWQVAAISMAGFLLAFTPLGWPVKYILEMFIP
ncbi:hypothetical protein [Streptomyces albus]|uniref:hypothetical protein n=1 Tax=Streptomyces albus TaxID=1888 RepID=UPI0033E7C071